jgi:hypothetical protein
LDDFVMGILSINEPDSGRTWMVTPVSINEPPKMDMPNPPVITTIAPDTAAIGDPDFTLVVTCTGFYADSVIVFAGNDEPTTLEADGTLTTGVDMNVWLGPDMLPVQVRNFNVVSNTVEFTFTEAGTRHAPKAHHATHAHDVDPDDLEDEIDEAADEGDFKPTHATRKKRKR